MKKQLAIVVVMLIVCSSVLAQSKREFLLSVEEAFLQVPVDANLIGPTGVAVNSKQHIFVTSGGSKKILEFDKRGRYVKSWAEGIVTSPHGLRIDKDDNVWVTDLEQHNVIKLDSKGRVSLVLGQKGNSGEFDETRQMALFFKPADIGFGRDGAIYVADGYGNARVVKLDKNGTFIKAWGVKGTEQGNFENPHNIVVDSKGLVYVADRNNSRIQIFSHDGEFIKEWTHLGKPWGLALSKKDILYMTDGTHEKVLKLDLNGHVLGEFGGPGQTKGRFRAAHGIAVDRNQNLYVTEVLNWRVQKLVQNNR